MTCPTRRTAARLSWIPKGWLLAIIATVGVGLLALGAYATVSTGQGADFGSVLNEPARTADDAVNIAWLPGEPLLRSLEPQTIEDIEFTWTRADGAVRTASAGGTADGVHIWFSGPARDQVLNLLTTGSIVDGIDWLDHSITPQFYSLDGQILMTTIERTGRATDGETLTDEVRVVFILRDGNWRIEHLVRTAGTILS